MFYERHPSNITIKWEAYAVSPEGTLWKRPSHLYPEPVATEPVCSRSGDNIPASVIHIEKPATCGRVWIAFSQHAWSEATFKAF
ncbi:toxin VasX, partial [Acinetobacter baumannii]